MYYPVARTASQKACVFRKFTAGDEDDGDFAFGCHSCSKLT